VRNTYIIIIITHVVIIIIITIIIIIHIASVDNSPNAWCDCPGEKQ
jgi:hypothetical protein